MGRGEELPMNEKQPTTITGSKVWRQGNSLVMTIPVEVKESMRLREGDKILLTLDGERLSITKDRS
jgi:antitoxin component of MazEF toxin-antitoxin module